ncbi:septum site-determining protein MinC [Paenibacillus antri]|uniref:Probable septum site-determining protein MinC n=1 Tax=Paenibacillus antri TaxID=2582848 RepID=A0A5R9GCR1_9BACL|nr:septum site-determining protein MinC [Paenibacillus antri]TLS53531.1 septum site-determining protein MinC [Paenibacillus antri]
MSTTKSLVTIKGVKEGLLFVLDDAAPLPDVLSDLSHKLEHTHSQFLTGPIVHVHVRLGKRPSTDETKAALKEAFAFRGNLLVQSIVSDSQESSAALPLLPAMKTITGIVRSGQTLHHDGDVLLLGDVNPGGTITSTGHILILGSLRGLAHAGVEGDDGAIIAASYLRPTQLRIAGVVSRPPDEWGFQEAFMEFAYLREGVMEIEKIHQLHRIRPQLKH